MKVAQQRVTKTGGRDATTRSIPPKLALAVAMPSAAPPSGWKWSALTDLARLESGHTPSRKHPEYWGGDIPWISIVDARNHHGSTIGDTIENTNSLGIENSSARVLPARTVCLSRTASVGYVVIMERPMATSQDFVNWVCTHELDPEFLKYLFIAEGEGLLRFASGAVHQTIYFPEAKAFHICHPPVSEQRRIVAILDKVFDSIAGARVTAERNFQNARELFEAHLDALFSLQTSGWASCRLEEICQLVNGRAYKKDELLSAGKYPVLRVGNFFTNQHWYYSDLELEPEKYCDEGDLLYAWSASFGPRIWSGKKVIFHYHIWKVLPDYSRVTKRFLMRLLEWDVEQIKSEHGTGTTMMHVSKGSMESRRISVPPLSEQEKITSEIDSVESEVLALESIYQRKLAALDELKQSLLHQAFSGAL